jgi:putative membrane protein
MTTSEQRLHPASLVFDFARYARIFAWPAVIALISGRRGGPPALDRNGFDTSVFEVWLWVLVLPSIGLSIARYLTFRIGYEPDQLVIRSGLLFRNVRHIPYARIQNLDAIQNLFHRALGVVEVRVETGGGSEPEARLRVLPVAALETMRTRVFAGRPGRLPPEPLRPPEGPAEGATHPDRPEAGRSSEAPRLLLHLQLRDLLLLGFLENRGLVLVGAAYGALWEAGTMNWFWSSLFEGSIDARGLFREVATFLVGRGPLPASRLARAAGGVAAFLVLVRLISMAWAVLRLHDFRLTRSGDDLRVTYGFFTRISATIPLRRIQTVTVSRGWLHRALGHASIRVETAGGPAGAATRDREWIAPLARERDTKSLLAEMLPVAQLQPDAWQPVHPRAFRRAVKPALAAALIAPATLVLVFGPAIALLAIPMLIWAVVSTRQHVRRLGWLAPGALIAFRSGWLSVVETFVRVNRVQSVTLRESPLDRRAGMARVRVDTAGAGEWSHRVDIPYLARTVAADLQYRLVSSAARTDFEW